MDIASLLSEHVYTAILLGGVIEGETAVALAGFAAYQGYVSLWAVIVLAAASNFCCDQGYYALGRWRGAWLLVRLPRLRPMVERMQPQLDRHRRWLIFSVRFMYGLRTVGPLALGVARVPWREFLIVNALGAGCWAVLFGTLGFVFGHAIATLVGEAAHYEARAAIAIVIAGLAWFACHRLRRARAQCLHPRERR